MDDKNYRASFIRLMPLLWISTAFLAGIFLARLMILALVILLFGAGLFVLASFILRKTMLGKIPNLRLARLSIILLSLSAFSFGVARYQATQRSFNAGDLAFYNDLAHTVEISGWLMQPPVTRDGYVELRVQAQEIELSSSSEPQLVSGGMLVRTSAAGDWQYGDIVLVRGRPQTPPEFEDFSYRAYLSRQGMDTLLSYAQIIRMGQGAGNPLLAALYSFRSHSLAHLSNLYPEPESSLLSGILLGDESGLSDQLKEDFNQTGARHIIAISGFNITIIAGLFLNLFRKLLGPRRGSWLAVFAIAAYTILVGADAPVVRAAIMGTLALFAQQVGRRQLGAITLAFSAAIMALFNPHILWDVGFQLSFAATLGLVLYSERLRTWADRLIALRWGEAIAEKLSNPIADYFLLTLAAQITTLPLLLYHFHRLSWLSIPTNILILPVQPALMIMGGLSLMAAFIFFPIAQLLAMITWPIVAFTIRIVEVFAALQWNSSLFAEISIAFVLAYYLGLAFLTFFRPVGAVLRAYYRPIFAMIALSVLTLWLWISALSAPEGIMHISILNVGAGEAILIQSPEGRNILINGGESSLTLNEALGRSLPLSNRKIDWLIVAGVNNEKIEALPSALERLAPARIAWSGLPSASFAARELRQQANALAIPITYLKAGNIFPLGQGASIDVVAVSEEGAVLLLQMQGFRFLLPIGLDEQNVKDLDWGKKIGSLSALLLTDSGDPDLNPPTWLANLAPDFFVLSADSLDRQLYTAEEITLASIEQSILRTDQHGPIHIFTDGHSYWIETGP